MPYLPGWIDRLTRPLQQGLYDGRARFWRTSLYTWRFIRLGAMLANRLACRRRDIYMTLEAIAGTPK